MMLGREPSPLNNVTTSQVSGWLHRFHAASATLNAKSWVQNFMTEDVSFQYANQPIVQGRENVEAWFVPVLAALDEMTHFVEYFDWVANKGTIYQAAKIRYVVKGDDRQEQAIEIRGFAVFSLRPVNAGDGNGEELKCWRAETYLDPTEVFNRITEKGLLG